jgi:hypothetical protein
MKPLTKVASALGVLALLATAPAFANTMRCGTHIIGDGATRSEVAAKCGEPDEVITQRSVFRRPVLWTNGRPYFIGENYIEIPVESWIFNLGPNKLMRKVIFEGGYVVEIETLGYGYNK